SVFQPGAALSKNFSSASRTRCQKSWRYSLTRVDGGGRRRRQNLLMIAARSGLGRRDPNSRISLGVALLLLRPAVHALSGDTFARPAPRPAAQTTRRKVRATSRRKRTSGV